MSENKNNEPDKTSKPNDALNVTPTNGESTSDNKATEVSSGDANTQAAVQKQVELRQKAEADAEEARKKAEEAEEARQKAEAEAKSIKEERIREKLANRIQSSNLPQTVKDRFSKDPVRYFIANQAESKEWTWGEVADAVGNVETLDAWMKDIEGTYGVASNPNNNPSAKDTFVDSDKPNTSTPSDGELTPDRIKNMSPYELAKLPEDVRNKLKEAGGIPD